MDTAIQAFVRGYVARMADTVYRALRKARRFQVYSTKIRSRIDSKTEYLISYEIARYVFGAWVEGTPPEGDLRKPEKDARHHLRISRNRWQKRQNDRLLEAEYVKAGAEWSHTRTALNSARGNKGRKRKDSARLFINKIAGIYADCTGCHANIGCGKNGVEQGSFSELLRETADDARKIYSCFHRAGIIAVSAQGLSGNLPRLARELMGKKRTI
jgi:hypothetical protein